jgi:membrane-associated phospholipid phosphatase
MVAVVVAVTLAASPVLVPRLQRPVLAPDVLRDFGQVLTRPLRLKPTDAFLLVPAAAATAIFLREDVTVFRAIHKTVPDPLLFHKRLSVWTSFLGEGLVDAGVFAGFAISGTDGGPRIALEGMEALLATAVVSRGMKWAFREERPANDGWHKHWFVGRGWWGADSMPSGHAMSAFATAAVLACEFPKLAPLFYALALCVGLARIQEAAHWPSDVVVGTALGIMIGREAFAINSRLRVAPFSTETASGAALVGRF